MLIKVHGWKEEADTDPVNVFLSQGLEEKESSNSTKLNKYVLSLHRLGIKNERDKFLVFQKLQFDRSLLMARVSKGRDRKPHK